MPQYEIAAAMINAEGLSLHHVDTFNLDEYADENGVTAPASWAGSFQRAMLDTFFGRIDAGSARRRARSTSPPPTRSRYADDIAQAGGADVCYGGIGWSGHIAFWEPHLGLEWEGDLDGYKQAGPRLVDLHPMTVMQNALHSFAGDWSLVPPEGQHHRPERDTRRPAPQLLARRRRWRRAVLAALHRATGRARPGLQLVPGSLLQETRADYTILGGVADSSVEIHLGWPSDADRSSTAARPLPTGRRRPPPLRASYVVHRPWRPALTSPRQATRVKRR